MTMETKIHEELERIGCTYPTESSSESICCEVKGHLARIWDDQADAVHVASQLLLALGAIKDGEGPAAVWDASNNLFNAQASW